MAELKPHGTVAAYKRHRRAKEDPCGPCLEANRENERRRYAERVAEKRAVAGSAVAKSRKELPRVESQSRRDDLLEQRKILLSVLRGLADADPSRVPAVSKELREVNREIDSLSDADAKGDVADEFNFDSVPLAPVSSIHSA